MTNKPQTTKDTPKPSPLLVGIGSSAGGLAALKRLLPTLPRGEGLAYVVLQHMDPSHPSMLPDILEKLTPLPVTLIEQGEVIAADTIYIAPAGHYCHVVGEVFSLDEPDTGVGAKHTIDALFASLADVCEERCVGIVLSGTGADGLQGIRAIKAAGGTAIVQDPASAQYPGMPRAVIHEVLADLILEPEAMGAALLDRVRPHEIDVVPLPQVSIDALAVTLMSKTGFDFTQYKESTLQRRVERRMSITKQRTLDDYATYLRDTEGEADFLLKDILISVTGFFRDTATFAAIESLLPAIIEAKSTGEGIRVWVAGCATGEEAYSMAMLIVEALGEKLHSVPVQIFATDFDISAIDHARRSVYLPSAVQDVPEPLLKKYFIRTDGTYQVNRRIRDMVVFAQHDLMQDPPFTRMDIVTCRNVLIYFKRVLQEQLITTFHYILNPNGYLVLGSSEGIGKFTELFKQPNKTHKIFQRRNVDHLPAGFLQTPYIGRRTTLPDQPAPRPRSHQQSFEVLLLEQYSPAGVLVNSRSEIVYVKGDVSRFIKLQPGDIKVDVVDMVIPQLSLEVRLALQKAQREKVTVRSNAIVLPAPFGNQQVRVVAVPSAANGDRQALMALLFEESDVLESDGDAVLTDDDVSSLRVRELEHELAATREHLQSNIEELETSNEELQSVNEEYQSTTEELQSTNEEFQTTNEELQSANEELRTVNEELMTKTEELGSANTDMEALLNVAVDGMVVLDSDMRVTRYSASSRRLFDLLPTSIGRPLIAVGGPFDLAFLSSEIQRAMQSGKPVDREIVLGERSYLVRLVPMTDDDSGGLVVTFTDESERLIAAAEARRLATVVKDSSDAITVLDLDGRITAWNRGAEHLYGYTEGEALALNLDKLLPAERLDESRAFIEAIQSGELTGSLDSQRRTKDGRVLDIWVTFTVLTDDRGQPVAIATTERDVTERRRHTIERRETERADIEARFDSLTPREKEVLARLAANPADPSSQTIADALGVSRRTIEHHRASIMKKMQAQSVVDLITTVSQFGLSDGK